VNGRSDLANAIGNEEAQLLAAVYGAGQRLFVPSSTAHAEHLEVILGLTATSALVHAYGGNYVYLPGLSPPTGHARGPTLAHVEEAGTRHERGPDREEIPGQRPMHLCQTARTETSGTAGAPSWRKRLPQMDDQVQRAGKEWAVRAKPGTKEGPSQKTAIQR
jgi:hypothetical protein